MAETKAPRGPKAEPAPPVGVFELTYPPRVMNLQWRLPRPEVDMGIDIRGNLIDFAKHLAEGPCPCYLLSLLPAHSGSRRIWLCWLYNAFREPEAENAYWRGQGEPEFLREHVDINRRLARMVQDGRDYWTFLRDDLSYRPAVPAAEFATTRFMQIEEVHVRPGRLSEFGELQTKLAEAYAAASVEQPAWVYEVYFGGPATTFQIWRPYSSFSTLDQVPEMRRHVDRALGDDGRALVSDRSVAAIAESDITMYSINPGGTYISAEIADAAPQFWKSRAHVFP